MSNSKLRVAIRCDASVAMGLGHVRRCFALASALHKAGVKVLLVSRDLGVDIDGLARDAGVAHISLPAPESDKSSAGSVPYAAWAGVDWKADAVQSVGVLSEWRPDWVIVDEYALDACWHRYVSEALGACIGAIDDLADRDLDVDLLVDQNMCANHCVKYRGRLTERTVVLGGPRFALLGPTFSSARTLLVRDVVRSVGVFMGGVDAGNFSGLVLRACRERAEYAGPVEIVTTRFNPHAAELRNLAAEWPNTVVTLDLPDLAQFYLRHDLQIGAGGGATWERCCVGAPSLVLTVASNQEAVLPNLADSGAIVLLGKEASRDEFAIGQTIRSMIQSAQQRRNLGQRARALVDGLGAVRVALRLAASSTMVRIAQLGDAQTMYAWRNHIETRRVSRDSSVIHLEDHQEWLSRTLGSPRCCLLVGYIGDIDVGIVRFDIDKDLHAEVSIYLDPKLYGLGLGTAVLAAGERHLVTHMPNIAGFRAAVREGNEASARLFKASGYEVQGDVWKKSALPKFTTQSE